MTLESDDDQVTTTKAPAPTSAIGRRPYRLGFWIIALAFLTQMAFCAVPTPLYAIYQQRDGFPTIVLTAIFAVYAVGVMLSLYLAAHVSDCLGRRPFILGSLLARRNFMFKVGDHVRARKDIKAKGLPNGARSVPAQSNGTVVAVQQSLLGGATYSIAFTIPTSPFPLLALFQREPDWELVAQ